MAVGLVPPIVVAFAVTAVLGEALRRFALRRQLLDVPNERSLHQQAVPRLGGMALVIGVAASLPLLRLDLALWKVLAVAGAVAVLGGIDDVRPLTPAVRFPMHLAFGTAIVVLCGPASVGTGVLAAGAITVFALAGSLNVYNFMDGMDGLAGAQAVFAGAAQALVFHSIGWEAGAAVAACVAAASGGFLLHNLPPAKMFMGDAGATTLGFVFAALAAVGSRHGVSPTVSLLPLGPFLLDGTFTLFRRLLRGEKVWRAHRSHLYQRAVQAGLTHRCVLAVYVAWCCVCALATALEARALLAGWIAGTAALVGVILWVRRLELARAL